MADEAHSNYELGSMDLSQHKVAYNGFLSLTKWTVIIVTIILILMGIFLV